MKRLYHTKIKILMLYFFFTYLICIITGSHLQNRSLLSPQNSAFVPSTAQNISTYLFPSGCERLPFSPVPLPPLKYFFFFSANLILGNRKKLCGAKSREFGGSSRTVMFFFTKSCLIQFYGQVHYPGARSTQSSTIRGAFF